MAEIKPVLTLAGFAEIELTRTFDCFRGTSKERTARKYGVTGQNVFARKPLQTMIR